MAESKKERYITGLIIILSITGAVYFGYHAIYDQKTADPDNPFEYNIDHFRQVDPALLQYNELRQIPVGMSSAYGIAIDSDDRLYITGNERLVIFSSEFDRADTIALTGTGFCIAVDQAKDIYIGMGKQIGIYDPAGNFKSQIALAGDHPLTTSLAVTEKFLYVADAGGHIVWQMSKKGEVLRKIGEKDDTREIPGFIIPSPFFDLAVDSDGFLWVVNPGRHSLENYTDLGDIRTSWGFYSMEIDGFCGCCNPGHLALLPDGSFITSEKGLARVKIYNRIGELTSVVAAPDSFTDGTVGMDLAVDSRQNIYVLDRKRKVVRIFARKDRDGQLN